MGTNLQSPAKITRPVPRGVLERNNLFRRLDKGLKSSVLWISAPAGSGKTSLVSSYIASRSLSSIWYQLDEGDADPATFFHYMGLAAKKAAPKKRKPLPHLTPEYLLGLPTFTRRFFEDLFSRLKTPFCLVLDNYQDVPEESMLHDLLTVGFGEMPEGGSVVVISRSDPPGQYSRLRANSALKVLENDGLTLSLSEAREIVRRRGNNVDEETIRDLHRKSGGWAAGLVLLLEGLREHVADTGTARELSHTELFNYFSNEILSRISPTSRDFLLKTSVFSRMTSAMAEELTGEAKGGKILTRLCRGNLFTTSRNGRKPVYQYHDLFRDFLVAAAEKRFGPVEMKSLRKQAASIKEAAGDMEDAAALYCHAEEWDGLEALLKKSAGTLLAQGRNRPLDRWLNCLPCRLLDADPWLLYWSAASLSPYDLVGARGLYKKALKLFRSSMEANGAFMAWSGLTETYIYGMDFTKDVPDVASMLDDLLREFGDPQDVMIDARVATAMAWVLTVSKPWQPETLQWEKRALELAERCGGITIKVQTLANHIYHLIQGGDIAQVGTRLREFRKVVHLKEAMPLPSLFMSCVETAYLNILGDHDNALASAEKWLSFSARTGVHIMDPILLGDAILSLLNKGETKRADVFLERMGAFYDRMRCVDASYYHYLLAHKYLLEGDLPKATAHAETAYQLIHTLIGNRMQQLLGEIQCANVYQANGDSQKALRHTQKALDIAKAIRSKIGMFYAHLTSAHIELASGKRDKGLNSLRKAMRLGSQQGYYTTHTWYPAITAELCTVALEESIETEYVKRLIRRRRLVPDPPPIEMEDWPWPVKVFTLGTFSLVVDGRPLSFEGKASKKPVEMLKTFIALGGREVAEDVVTDVLWPDAEGPAAHSAFTTTLSRLRNLLRANGAINVSDGRITLDSGFFWVDTWAFERLLIRSEEALKAGDMELARECCEKASSLYQGPFLSTESAGPWGLTYRERLRSRFIRYMSNYAAMLEEAGDDEHAIECFKKGLEVEPQSETFCQRLLVCLKKTGRRAEAVSTYRNFKKLLSTTLGIEPSARTVEIYNSL